MSCITRRATLLLAGFASCLSTGQLLGQDSLNGDVNAEVSRVIQLRSKIDTAADAVESTAAQTERLAQNPMASQFTSPAEIEFDEISSRATPIGGGDNTIAQPTVAQPTEVVGKLDAPIQIGQPRVESSFQQVSSPRTRTEFLSPPSPTKTEAKPKAYRIESARATSTPTISTSIVCPKDINVNESAPFQINVQNLGKSAVENIQIIASLPSHVRYENASLPAENVDGLLKFSIPALGAGQNRQITLEITPTEKRAIEIGSQVSIQDTQQISVNVRQPQLAIRVDGPDQINIGKTTTHKVTIENIGDGIAQQVRLEADFPGELRFLEQQGMKNVRSLKPGEKVQVTVKSLAQASGLCKLDFVASGARCQPQPASAPLKVTQPELKVSAVGPDMNFVERDGIYTIAVDNAGETDVKNVQVTLAVPPGMKVTTISRQAKVNSKTGTLNWTFPNLKAQSNETIQLKATALQAGEQVCRIVVSSDETNEKEFALKTVVATRADLSINMNSVTGPVQVGTEAEFSIVVVNRGSSIANDIQIQVELPEAMTPVNQSNAFIEETENAILFMDARLEPGKKKEFRFKAVGVTKGEHVIRSVLQTAGSERRVIAEDSVYVYEPAEARVSESLSPTVPR